MCIMAVRRRPNRWDIALVSDAHTSIYALYLIIDHCQHVIPLQDTVGKPIECKAAIAWEAKKPLEVTTVTVNPPGPGEVRVHSTPSTT